MTRGKPSLFRFKVVLPYTESRFPGKQFQIEYTIEAENEESALKKAEQEFNRHLIGNLASWVRTLDPSGVSVKKIETPYTNPT